MIIEEDNKIEPALVQPREWSGIRSSMKTATVERCWPVSLEPDLRAGHRIKSKGNDPAYHLMAIEQVEF